MMQIHPIPDLDPPYKQNISIFTTKIPSKLMYYVVDDVL